MMEIDKSKQLPYEDDFEFWCNLMRIAVTVLYLPLLFFSVKDLGGVKEFLYEIGNWSVDRYFFFFAPLLLALINVWLLRLGKRSGVPMPSYSRHFIYSSLVVSVIYYGICLVALFR